MLAAGCTVSEYGESAVYSASVDRSMQVLMDPRAPSISQQYRVTYKPVSEGGPSSLHEGIDIVARTGTPILAAAPGQVVRSFSDPAYGNQLVIDHGVDTLGKKTITIYRHLSTRIASKGATVARGQQIGTMGRTGILAGGISHLHFEVHREIRPGATRPLDPHGFWANGVGRVTCFDPTSQVGTSAFVTTYPVQCRTM
jgi:murein DD-endopeptidase MepM/ murein hydrolase activator NlpD